MKKKLLLKLPKTVRLMTRDKREFIKALELVTIQ